MMRSIADTIDRLRRIAATMPSGGDTGRLVPLTDFGRNPGELDALLHVPAHLPAGSPLVVVLHGCTQNAAVYDRGSGWSALADACRFAVLFAQQRQANNPNLCFNWFLPGDTRRGQGEAESIRQMVVAMIARHRIDPARVFVTGLSAGGAMTSVMLATCPDLFAAGAIIAGLPYGVATNVPEALERMRGQGYRPDRLSQLLRDASTHRGPWPRVAIWHGSADTTVVPGNAAMIVQQWRGVHAVGAPEVATLPGRHRARIWRDADGRAAIEEHLIDGLAHGTPIATAGNEAYGAPGPHMLDVGVSSTYRIAASWGIAPAVAPARATPSAGCVKPAAAARTGPVAAINEALRSAGLIRD